MPVDGNDRFWLSPIKKGRRAGHRPPHVVDDKEGDAGDRVGRLALGHDDDRAVLDCLRNEAQAIRLVARDREEDEARHDLAAVRRQATNLDDAEPSRARRLGQKRRETCQWSPSFECCGILA